MRGNTYTFTQTHKDTCLFRIVIFSAHFPLITSICSLYYLHLFSIGEWRVKFRKFTNLEFWALTLANSSNSIPLSYMSTFFLLSLTLWPVLISPIQKTQHHSLLCPLQNQLTHHFHFTSKFMEIIYIHSFQLLIFQLLMSVSSLPLYWKVSFYSLTQVLFPEFRDAFFFHSLCPLNSKW